MPRLLSLAVLCGLLSACDDSPVTIPRDAVAVESFAMLTDFQRSQYDGLEDRQRIKVSDNAAWTALWQEMTKNVVPAPEVPTVDFTSESVIVAAMGRRATGGFSISIEGVEESGGTLYVRVHERSPGSGCMVTQATTAPIHVIRVAGTHSAVVFVERTSVKNC